MVNPFAVKVSADSSGGASPQIVLPDQVQPTIATLQKASGMPELWAEKVRLVNQSGVITFATLKHQLALHNTTQRLIYLNFDKPVSPTQYEILVNGDKLYISPPFGFTSVNYYIASFDSSADVPPLFVAYQLVMISPGCYDLA